MILNETSALNGAQRFSGWDWVTGMIDDDKAAQAVREAVKRGYPLVDTGNERGVGEGGAVRGAVRGQSGGCGDEEPRRGGEVHRRDAGEMGVEAIMNIEATIVGISECR